jgi:hypothetical protein
MTNPWLTHLAKVRRSHPSLSVPEAAKLAKKSYHKKKAPKKAGTVRRKRAGIVRRRKL